ncbi:MAG: SNF2 helicase-associated domain-containing protein, partial [Actinomycetes bacterium]
MFVLHGCWLRASGGSPAGRLGLWAEDSSGPATPPRRRGRPPAEQPHPYAAEPADLVGMLPPAAAGVTAGAVTLTLPSRGGGPLGSPELIRDEVADTGGPLRPGRWQVPVLKLDADRAFAVLRTCDPEAAAYGASVAHLIEVARFAADLVARGRLLPLVVPDPPTGPRAVWRPVLTGPDAAWTRVLASSMPPALTAAESGQDRDVWADALDSLVDAAARAALGSLPLAGGRAGTPAARAWLAALSGRERTVKGAAPEVAALAAAISAWQQDAAEGPVRACFRLIEPAEDAEDWSVRFALQATDEPSLVVEADAVWRSRGTLPALARRIDAPQETFLAELGKASRLYGELDGALRSPRPSGLALDTDGAHRFLSVAAPTLATAGFGVQLPGWWTKPSSRLGLRVTASTPPQPGLVTASATTVGFDAIAAFRYDLAVGGEVLTADELAELAENKASLVRVRGQWVELDGRRLAAGLRLVGRTGEVRVGELLRLGLGVEGGSARTEDLPVTEVTADGWLGELLSGRVEHRVAPVPVPDSFTGQLRPYQARGLAWLDFLGRAGLGGVLADDM